ncbi:FabD/lysophospholipase-like protein [Daldinia bambusicola]|nr:FabD/lysophospholipase-like protein [Daldinia bambusicola]
MTTTEAIEAYYDFSGKIFSKRNRKGFMAYLAGHPFNELPLEKIIKDMVATRQIGELMIDPKPEARSKAFVCSQPAHKQGQATRFRTYEPPPPLKRDASLDAPPVSGSSSSPSTASSSLNTSSQSSGSSMDNTTVAGSPRPENSVLDPWNEYRDIQIWEAARATTAAPSYFDPIVLSRGGDSRAFIDGAMGCNNPAKEVVDEAAALFGTDCVLGCLVSLGTGFSGEVTIGQAQKGLKKIIGLINNLKKIATNTEEVHEGLRRLIRADLDTYFRFQLPTGAENIRLHDYKKLDELSRLMKLYIEKESAEIDKVVRILINKAKPRGITLGQVAHSDHGQICPPPMEIRGRPLVSEFFTGRYDIIRTLAKDLCPDKLRPNRVRHHLVYGQSGIGKSQVATKFLEVYSNHFDLMLWVDAASTETLEAGFRALTYCSEYGYVGDGSPRSLILWLENTDLSWILVLDDARGDVSKYVPNGKNGAVLFTSQTKFIKPAQKWTTMLDAITEKEALELLFYSAQLTEVDRHLHGEAIKLVRSLGYLPLAIEQAGKTLRMKEWRVTEYAAELEIQQDKLLNKSGYDCGSVMLRGVHASFDVTYKVLNKQAHGDADELKAQAAKYALQLLNLFCFYHNEGLTGSILKRAATYRPPDRQQDDYGVGIESYADLLALDEDGKWIEQRWQLGMDLLISYALVKVTKSSQARRLYSLHNLVHCWARERMSEHSRCARAKSAELILFDSIPESQTSREDYLYSAHVIAHAKAVMNHTGGLDIEGDQPLDSVHLYKYALLMNANGIQEKSIMYCGEAAELTCRQYGLFCERTLKMYDSVIKMGKEEGLLRPALELQLQVQRVRIVMHGDGLHAVRSLSNGATIVILLGEFEVAEAILRDNLKVLSEQYPDEEQLTIKTGLAIVCYHTERLDEARDLLVGVIHEYEERLGETHPDTLANICNLAAVLTKLGDLDDAEDLLKHVMEVESKEFGPYYMMRSYSLHNLAAVYYAQGKYDEALRLFKEACALYRAVSDATVKCTYHYQGMAMVKYKQGKRRVAIRLMNTCCRGFGAVSRGHVYKKTAEQQRDAWMEEEEKGLPIQEETISQIVSLFRF